MCIRDSRVGTAGAESLQIVAAVLVGDGAVLRARRSVYGCLLYTSLLASYVEEIRIGLLHNGVTELTLSDGTTRLVEQASMLDFMRCV